MPFKNLVGVRLVKGLKLFRVAAGFSFDESFQRQDQRLQFGVHPGKCLAISSSASASDILGA